MMRQHIVTERIDFTLKYDLMISLLETEIKSADTCEERRNFQYLTAPTKAYVQFVLSGTHEYMSSTRSVLMSICDSVLLLPFSLITAPYYPQGNCERKFGV